VTEPKRERWWGEREVPEGSGLRLAIGPLRLWVQRSTREWRIASVRGDDRVDPSLEVAPMGSEDEPPEEAQPERVAATETSSALHVRVGLPDRPVVVRPEVPLRLLSGHEATFYCRFPLWLILGQGTDGQEILRVPAYRPSDTFFGPSTIEGELCYALRTRAHADISALPVIPFRIVSCIHVRNRGGDALAVERIKLPTDQLTLYGGDEGWLGTDDVRVDREEDGSTVRVRALGAPPRWLRDPEVLVSPSKHRRGGVLGSIGAWLR
jgi:hypothetical protein